MNRLAALIIAGFLGVPCMQAQAQRLPQFQEYSVASTFKGKPASAKIVGPQARLFRTMIRQGASEGPNFAGHYTLVSWGCGSGCKMFAIVDARTGRVYIPAGHLQLDTDPWLADDPFAAEEKVQFRNNSRLLVLVGGGYFGKKARKKGKYFYEWSGNRLKLVRSIQRHYY